ncbi:tetratricopeptide repeat protein [Bacillus sp. 1NLA3E]|uniref:tetratricopeptide repeat protein n=1 Tax=Bacillus sp. 1NLA3E TaxID=666686 RepID=UPI000247E936|nr:HSR1-like GTP-binding protein [Bacillus sp. 1NLA3E]AGK52186.1 HSR1-like GTP-binding protein [Bacillus sp. 1NLA3E]
MFEEQLIKKSYYENFLEPNDNRHPVQVLGEVYMKEQAEKLPDLSQIRFAQGEVYFRAKDFETAIFKWESINNELEPWAKKNMADAYLELELFSTAEGIYQSIITDSLILNTELAIQLFSLFIQEGKVESAVHMIKQAVSINPDYPNVSTLARMFFEEQQDWENALDLAVNEVIRTEKMQWVDTVIDYIEMGHTKSVKPEYFSEVLTKVMNLDSNRFDRMASSLWKNYKQEKVYFTWLKEFNRLFENSEIEKNGLGQELSILYHETYFYLLDGKYLIKEISDFIPSFLANWLKVADPDHISFAAAALLAWSEVFPSSISGELVNEAESSIYQSKNSKTILKDSLELFNTIVTWAEGQGILVSPKLKWIIEKLADVKTMNLLIAGDSGNGRATFLHKILGEPSLDANISNVMYTNHDIEGSYEINDSELIKVASYKREIDELSEPTGEANWREVQLSNVFLRENSLALINALDLNGGNSEGLYMADSLVFLVNDKEPFTGNDREVFIQIQNNKPDLPVHFLLMKSSEGKTENLTSIIKNYFPAAKLFTISLNDTEWGELNHLGEFLKETVCEQHLEEERAGKVLIFVKKLISLLLEKRVELENSLVNSVKWNEQMNGKYNGAIHQLSDLKLENIRMVKNSFQKAKEDIQHEVIDTIPRLLKECSRVINENSDFRKIHLELNEEMNRRIDSYMKEIVLPKFHDTLQAWIEESKNELIKSQAFLDELGDAFNVLLEEERIQFFCDLKVLDDWRRDVTRMTSNVHLDKVNILLRMTPSQVLLKSAGKFLGVLSQNKSMLSNKYKNYIEHEDYYEIAVSIAAKLILQIELFENGLERDMTMFFQNPNDVLGKLVEETNEEISANRKLLKEMRSNPEIYNDPMTFFQIRLRQYEWVMLAGSELRYQRQ